MKLPIILLVSICTVALLTGCASNPGADQAADTSTPKPTCATDSAPTGSNIRPHKCGSTTGAVSIDPADLGRVGPATNTFGDPSRSH